MSAADDLPPEIEVDSPHGVGVRYRFPRRQFAGLKVASLVAMLVGLFGLGFMAFWVCGFAGGFAQAFGPLGLLSGLLAIPGFIGASAAIGLGLALRFGHAEIEVSDGIVRAIERVGPFRWTRRRSAADIRRFVVDLEKPGGKPASAAQPGKTSRLDLFVLQANLANGKAVWLAFAYPREWLLAVAHRLAVDCHAAQEALGESSAEIQVVDVPAVEPGEVDRLEQPQGSQVIYEPLPGGMTLNVPARGIWRGSGGLFSFSLLWLGFMTVFTSMAVEAFLNGNAQQGSMIAFAVIVPLFWAVGVLMLLAAIHMGRRRAGLAVANGQLMILQKGPFGSKTSQWELTALQTVRVGPSKMEVNDRPVMELQIVPHEGQPFGMFAGRDVPEIEWIATLLRAAVREAPSTTT